MTAQSMNYTVVINGAVWGGALAYYYIDARKWFTGTIFDYSLPPIPFSNPLSFPHQSFSSIPESLSYLH